MALELTKKTGFGVDATYWKIAQLNINWHDKKSHVAMIGFPSKEVREANKQPIMGETFDFQGDDFPFTLDGNNVTEAYAKIKESKMVDDPENEGEQIESNEWNAAVDVLDEV